MNVSEELIVAAKGGNIKDVKKLLSKGALFTKDKFGNTALHEAAWTGNNDIVKLLLKSGCFVDSVNSVGFTPLHLSSQNGHAKATKTLLKWKANTSLQNQHQEAPIHLVAKYDHAHLVPLYAAARVDLDIKAKDGNTALHIAAKLGYTSTVKVLIHSGANPNHTNVKKKLPIDYAEIGDYHDTVKLLIPLTERPAAIGRRATMSGSRPKTPDTESLHSHYKRPFFNRSPRSFKIPKTNKKKSDSPRSVHEGDIRMRQRSSTTVGPAMRRYSKEFEDLPPRLFSYSSTPNTTAGSPLFKTQRSARKSQSPSLDDLLEEIEKETHGPDYKFLPPQSDDSEDNSSVTYKPLQRISVNKTVTSPSPSSRSSSRPTSTNLSHCPLNFSLPNLAVSTTPRSSIVSSPSPLLHTNVNPIYDYLSPRGSKTTPTKTTPEVTTETTSDKSPPRASIPKSDSGDSYVSLSPVGTDKRTSPDGQDDSIYSHPVLSDEILRHHYEYLPPLTSEEKERGGGEGLLKEDFESYVYMAPRNDCHLPPTNVCPSPSPSSPALRKGLNSLPRNNNDITPDAIRRLSIQSDTSSCSSSFAPPSLPPSGPQKGTQLERYLEEELETMQQAFQIRLAQMEKRYERRLHTMSSSSPLQSRTNSYTSPPNSRCTSWHMDVEPSTSLSNWNSKESVASSNGCHRNGLDQVSDLGQPKVCDFVVGDGERETNEQIVQERIKDYKSKMMEYLMERAEQQMMSMEKEYERKLQEKFRQQKSLPNIILQPSSPQLHHKSETFV